jgi:hypothetical protein
MRNLFDTLQRVPFETSNVETKRWKVGNDLSQVGTSSSS